MLVLPPVQLTNVVEWLCYTFLSFFLALTTTAAPSARELSLTSQLKKLQETIEQRTKIEIGDIIRVRGYVRTYREEREIHATVHCKQKIFFPKWLLFWWGVQ